jgi:hypothetical protein
MSKRIISIVKLDDAQRSEKRWCVVEVRVSARVMGYVANVGAGTFKTRREAVEHVEEMRECEASEKEQAVRDVEGLAKIRLRPPVDPKLRDFVDALTKGGRHG